jgi:alanyl-tRNA synthetase
MQSSEIGQAFVEHYQSEGYTVLPSAPLLDPSIPMTFVMSAGLVQIEMALDQAGKRTRDKYALLQKCFRHFDVETIGTTDFHLSLFEMPGAFFFSPDSKPRMIQEMWGLLTDNLKINAANLWVTYFSGGEISGHRFEEDTDALRAWQEIGLPEERIVGLGVDNNFWMQGPGIEGAVRYRKCGPHTEVFFDRGVQLSCGPNCLPGCRCGRFVELANTLFLSTERDTETEKLRPLSTPFTETVIGTERVAMISQDKVSVFEIDCMRPAIATIRQFHNADDLSNEVIVASENILADHLRALLFLAADGAPPPGKNGRERIIKILIRRALASQMVLGIHSPAFLSTVLDAIINTHKEWPKLASAHNTVLTYFGEHSKVFKRTLERGHRQLERYLKRNGSETLTGQQIVSLEKKFGMPSVLVETTLREKGLLFDHMGYEHALAEWRRRLESVRQVV